MKDKLAYTVQEACDATGLSRWTLARLLKAGKLDAAKIGGRVLVTRQGLENLIEDGRKAYAAQVSR